MLIKLHQLFVSTHLQEPLPSNVRVQILSELRSLADVVDVMNTLDIAIGFLSPVGGNPKQLISEYLKNVLRMASEAVLKSRKVQ